MDQQKRMPVDGKIGKRRDAHLSAVSKRYSAAMYVMFALSVVFFVFAVTTFGDYITTDNLNYVARDWSSVSASSGAGFSEIVFGAENDMTAEYFRGGLAVAGNDIYKYYDNSGAELFVEETGCSEPEIGTSSKYLLLYDEGGTSYSVYNQLTRIITRNTDNEILTGDISANGSFVLVTRSDSTKYEVHLFNSALNEVMKIPESAYITDAAISPDGQKVITCAIVPSYTDLSCRLEIRMKGTQEPLLSSLIEHTMPFTVTALDDRFVLLCDTGVYYYDYNGGLLTSYKISGASLDCFDISDESAILVCSLNALGSENRITVFDRDGSVLSEETVSERVCGAYASVNTKNALGYFTMPESLVKIGTTGEHETAECIAAELNTVIPLNTGVLAVHSSYAVPVFAD